MGPVKRRHEQARTGFVCTGDRVLCRLRVISRVAYYCVSARQVARCIGRFRLCANHGEMRKDGGSPTEQMSPALAACEAPTKLAAQTTKSVPPALPESHELTWVTVLLPARVHAGPSINTPIIQVYSVGTPLHATRYWNDWIEVNEPDTSKSGWIYRKYLGAISNYEQGKIASQEAQEQRPVVSAKRYAKTVPVKRNASTVRSSKQATRFQPATPFRGRTEMASLLQRAFSGY